ncbi:MAG TPA: efflux RND transporter permease subunit, partial [Casimicrobiaceae bacterium]|nr:efflux RND transporter permease subunit [Casimicrobiaceae bacterium]
TVFVTLKPWDKRNVSADDVIKYVSAKAGDITEGNVLAFSPVPIRGIGTSGGFEVYVQDRSGGNPLKLNGVVQQFVAALRERTELVGVNSFFRPTVPQLLVDVDREKAVAMGVPINELFAALQSTMGTLYVNDFNRLGRTYRVQLQAEGAFRARPDDLGNVYARSATTGEMIPIKTMLDIRNIVGPEQLDRYNGFLAAKVIGSNASSVSSGQAIAVVEEVAAKSLPPGYTIALTGQAYQEKRIGSASAIAFIFALIMVFLILSANYERWSLPAAVLLAVPFALLGALIAVTLRGMNNDVYFQIGLVVLIGLAAKNAILIVEFATQKQAEGMGKLDAAIEAARLRFRPIVMTSVAFVLGVLPLVLATGAGAAARRSMGTGVFGGMLVATFVATLFIPLFYVLLRRREAKPAIEAPTILVEKTA